MIIIILSFSYNDSKRFKFSFKIKKRQIFVKLNYDDCLFLQNWKLRTTQLLAFSNINNNKNGVCSNLLYSLNLEFFFFNDMATFTFIYLGFIAPEIVAFLSIDSYS